MWEERFGEQVYGPLAEAALADALKEAGLTAGQVDHLIVAGLPTRAVSRSVRAAEIQAEAVVHNRVASIGNAGTAQPGILLADVLDRAGPDETVLLMVLANGVTVLALRTTEALASHRQPQPVAAQIAAGSSALEYATFFLARVPGPRAPRPPDPDPVAAPPAQRRVAWKFGSRRPGAPTAARAACRRTGSASNATRWTRRTPSHSPTCPRP